MIMVHLNPMCDDPLMKSLHMVLCDDVGEWLRILCGVPCSTCPVGVWQRSVPGVDHVRLITRRVDKYVHDVSHGHRCTVVVQVSVYFVPMDIDKLFKVLYTRRSVLSLVYIEKTSGTKNPHRGKQTAHARRTIT